VLALAPDHVEARSALGAVLHRQGRHDEALDCFRQVLARSPDDARALGNLGATLHALARDEEAVDVLERAIAARPGHAATHFNMGLALGRLRRFEDAIASLRRAVGLAPCDAAMHHALGVALLNAGDAAGAIASHRQALVLDPGFAEAHCSLATALREHGDMEAALDSARQAVALQPELPGALSVALQLSQALCDWRLLAGYSAAALAGAGRILLSPFVMLSVTDDAAVLQRVAAHYCAERVGGAPMPAVRREPAAGRIALGYLSPDLQDHVVAHLAAGLFEHHDRARFEVHALSLGTDDASPMRQRLRRAFDTFLDADRLSDRAVAGEIRRLGIDILVDLGGHTRGSRPGIAALRPAPVQVSYFGYPGTTGAAFLDYVLVDRFAVPPAQQAFFSERLVHLPDSYQVNDRTRAIAGETPSRAQCGLPEAGFVFCCFSNPSKITPVVFDVWMRLLRAVPQSVLWLQDAGPRTTANLRREAHARGVDAARLACSPKLPLAAHLARHRLADLYLDTLPYNAHGMGSDALWAGLPLLTCAGRSFAARVCGSLLHAVGLPELVTASLADYEALALRLASDPALLGDIRARLAANRLSMPLFDIDRFRRHIEAAYTRMWVRHLRGEPPEAFAVAPD
jgi:predicted O-linked N-acetylglucosamine transferase (SPINDLY family)